MSEWKEKFVKAVINKLKETDTPYHAMTVTHK